MKLKLSVGLAKHSLTGTVMTSQSVTEKTGEKKMKCLSLLFSVKHMLEEFEMFKNAVR